MSRTVLLEILQKRSTYSSLGAVGIHLASPSALRQLGHDSFTQAFQGVLLPLADLLGSGSGLLTLESIQEIQEASCGGPSYDLDQPHEFRLRGVHGSDPANVLADALPDALALGSELVGGVAELAVALDDARLEHLLDRLADVAGSVGAVEAPQVFRDGLDSAARLVGQEGDDDADAEGHALLVGQQAQPTTGIPLVGGVVAVAGVGDLARDGWESFSLCHVLSEPVGRMGVRLI
jgi:hypothetical protein